VGSQYNDTITNYTNYFHEDTNQITILGKRKHLSFLKLIQKQGQIFIFLKIASEVQTAPLSELRQGLGVRIKDFHTKEEG
jgi:hypothetical protein